MLRFSSHTEKYSKCNATSYTASTAYVTSNAASKANIYFLTNILFTIRPCTFWRTM